MTNTIEFAASQDAGNNETTSPWAASKVGNYEDLVLKPEYAARRLRFQNGQTWMRIVPALKESAHGWMIPIHVLNFAGGRFAHPKTHRRNAKGVFDGAFAWFLRNNPEGLYSKVNRSGARLLTDPMCACWVLVEEEGRTVARIFFASGYDGSRGGAPGLGYQLWRLTKDRDENGTLTADPVAPEAGLLVCVEKSKSKGAKYPNYTLRLGRQPAPVNAMLAKADPEEVRVLCPLEQTARELSAEEEWQCLARVIAAETAAEIRTSLTDER